MHSALLGYNYHESAAWWAHVMLSCQQLCIPEACMEMHSNMVPAISNSRYLMNQHIVKPICLKKPLLQTSTITYYNLLLYYTYRSKSSHLDNHIRQLDFEGLHSIVQWSLTLFREHVQHRGVPDGHILFTDNRHEEQLNSWCSHHMHSWSTCHTAVTEQALTLGLSLSLGAVHKEYLTDQASTSNYVTATQ